MGGRSDIYPPAPFFISRKVFQPVFRQAAYHGLFTVLYILSDFLCCVLWLCYSVCVVVAPVFTGSDLVLIVLVAC